MRNFKLLFTILVTILSIKCFAQQTSGTINGHEWVDLGLSSGLRWATHNIGASSPSDYGNYYAFGETTTKREYTINNHFDSGIDVARAIWGDKWRLPTMYEYQELIKECKWVWTTRNGHKGYLVTGPNGNSIFIPAAGYRYKTTLDGVGASGHYWNCNAQALQFNVNDISYNNRPLNNACGSTIRPVSDPPKQMKPATNTPNNSEWVDLGLPSGLKWATCNVGAASPSDYGYYYMWGEISTKAICSARYSKTYRIYMKDISGNPQYDAARANLGDVWRMPTKTEMEELIKKCKWVEATQGNHNGYKVIGPNGKSIFLPLSGMHDGGTRDYVGKRGYYWTSSPNFYYPEEESCCLEFYGGVQKTLFRDRFVGFPIRPVLDKR